MLDGVSDFVLAAFTTGAGFNGSVPASWAGLDDDDGALGVKGRARAARA